jgi:membrane protease YdiL (CAAX protease family)
LTAPSPGTQLGAALRRALVDRVPRDHDQTDRDFRRRRTVAAVTLVAGTTLLGLSLATRPGADEFYPLTGAVAVVWVLGGLASGPLHLGFVAVGGRLRRPVLTPLILGLAASAVFVLGALVVREIEPIRQVVSGVLDHERRGDTGLVYLVTIGNGVAEEIFFRGALFAAIGRRNPVVASTVLYAAVTVATWNVMLVFAAAVMGTLFALQRRASGGVLAPAITHVTWSALMLLALPPLLQ